MRRSDARVLRRARAGRAAPMLVPLFVTGAAALALAEPIPQREPLGSTGHESRPGIPLLSSLGRLERESVEEALAQLGLAIDPSPEGKLIGHVYVVNHEVFSRRDGSFQLLNLFHATTRPGILGRELLLSPGQRWDAALVEESIRNLQEPPPLFFSDGGVFAAPPLSSVVALVPVVSSVAGTVDLLAVTRDLWSLRFNTEFEFQKNTLSFLKTSLSENNLLGRRKYLAAGFELDQGRYGVGPTFLDPNVAGTRLMLLATGTAWYAREGDRYEGNNELLSLRYPLYALARRWGAGLDLRHRDAVVRHFCDNEPCPVDVAGVAVPFTYRRRTLILDSHVVRSFGRTVIQRVTAGYRFDRRRSRFSANPADPTLGDEFLARWAPPSETRSEPYLRYELFTARYGAFRDLDTFDLRENRRLGPQLALELAAGRPVLGADVAAWPMSATVGWAIAPGGSGFGLAQAQASARARAGELVDQRLSAVLYLASPVIAGAGRVVLSAMTDAVRADTYRTRLFLGGDTGLRGYQIGEFQGKVQLAAHAEIRTAPLAIHSQRFGAILFYDMGHAAPSYGELVPHHDVGVGLRWLIPQLNSSVLRVDWAVATRSGPYTDAGFPGRLTAGFMQSFWLLDSPKGYLPSYR